MELEAVGPKLEPVFGTFVNCQSCVLTCWVLAAIGVLLRWTG